MKLFILFFLTWWDISEPAMLLCLDGEFLQDHSLQSISTCILSLLISWDVSLVHWKLMYVMCWCRSYLQSYFFLIWIMALATFTRLDAFCALQGLWQFKHLLTIVLLIRTSSRYVLPWYLFYLWLSTVLFIIWLFKHLIIYSLVLFLARLILPPSFGKNSYIHPMQWSRSWWLWHTCNLEIRSSVLLCHINFKWNSWHCVTCLIYVKNISPL